MKAVTEFPIFKLVKGIQAKTALAAEGKSPEEIQTSLGETFKLEGEKLAYFTNALDVASANSENLFRVLVVKLNEGETAPAKATKVDECHYIPEFTIAAKQGITTKADAAAKNNTKGKGKGGPKESPWGLSPEQEALKKGKKAANQAPKAE